MEHAAAARVCEQEEGWPGWRSGHAVVCFQQRSLAGVAGPGGVVQRVPGNVRGVERTMDGHRPERDPGSGAH